MSLKNAHDRFVKQTLGKVETAQSFLEHSLPETIKTAANITTLEPLKDSYINKELIEGFSDLLFKTEINGNAGYIYFLIEHKSYQSKGVTLQLLKYMLFIWQDVLKNNKNEEILPYVLPIVLFHHPESLKSKRSLGAYFPNFNQLNDAFKRFVPDFEYFLYDLRHFDDENFTGLPQLRILFLLLRDVPRKDDEALWKTYARALDYLDDIEDIQTAEEFNVTMTIYLYSVLRATGKKDYQSFVKDLKKRFPERSLEMKTIADMLREDGAEEGKREGKKEMINNLLADGLDIQKIAQYAGLSEAEVKKMIEELKH